jgi:predicted nucleotidyltransferase
MIPGKAGNLAPVRTEPESDSLARCMRRLREALAVEPTVRWAYLFGSAARGEEFRDLDVAVMLTADARGAVAFGRVASRAETAGDGQRVDVVDLASAAPALIGRIVREGRVLVDHEPAARRSWEIDANLRALDIEPWLAEFTRLHNESIRRRGFHGRP